MSNATETNVPVRSPRSARTAEDLMTRNPVSLRDTATVEEAVAFLTDTGFSAAPVIDQTGRPVGVISRTDIVVYDRRKVAPAPDLPDYYSEADLPPADTEAGRRGQTGAQVPTHVRDLMTPAVFSVAPDTPVDKVAAQMVELNVHRLFVVERSGVLVGVISALDLLRHFCS